MALFLIIHMKFRNGNVLKQSGCSPTLHILQKYFDVLEMCLWSLFFKTIEVKCMCYEVTFLLEN